MQKILFIKNSIEKSTSRTEETYKAASEQLVPEERLAIAFAVEELSEAEVSYDSDNDDSDFLSFNLNLVDHTSVLTEIDSEIVNFDYFSQIKLFLFFTFLVLVFKFIILYFK